MVGQTARLGLIVEFVRQAWLDIQNSANWRFLYRDIPTGKSLAAGTACYAGTVRGLDLPRFRGWIVADAFSGNAVSLQDPDEDRGDEQRVGAVDSQVLARQHYFGAEADTQERPLVVAINDANELCFGPIPDKNYILRGRYVRGPQIFALDADGAPDPDDPYQVPEGDSFAPDRQEPIMPADYHAAIKWKALRLLGEFDEADALVLQTTDLNFRRYYDAMRRDLLRRGGPYIDTEGGLGGSLGGRSFGIGSAGFGPPPTAGF